MNYKEVFKELVKKSWDKYFEIDLPSHLDDLLVGYVISFMVGRGYKMIDFTSDGIYHYLRFEGENRHRIMFRLRNLAESYQTAKVMGLLARIDIGYGEPVREFSKVWSAIKAEAKSRFIVTDEPGVVRMDADVVGKYAYAIVGLLLDMGEYITLSEGKIEVDINKLGGHLLAVAKTLRDYLKSFLGVL